MGLFDFYVQQHSEDQQDLRPLTVEEIYNIQVSQRLAMQNASNPYSNYLANSLATKNMFQPLYQNYSAQKPLDERFADFKVRLEAAIHRTELAKLTGTANQVHMGTIK